MQPMRRRTWRKRRRCFDALQQFAPRLPTTWVAPPPSSRTLYCPPVTTRARHVTTLNYVLEASQTRSMPSVWTVKVKTQGQTSPICNHLQGANQNYLYFWSVVFLCGQTDRQTHTHTHTDRRKTIRASRSTADVQVIMTLYV